MKAILIFIQLIIMSNSLFAQKLDSIKIQVHEDFCKTFKQESFTINEQVNTNFINEEEIYFEISIVPKVKGILFIKQQFTYEENWGYKNNSILNIVKVNSKGNARLFTGNEPNPFLSYTCSVGDTILIPVFWNKHILSNSFSKGEEIEHEIYGKINDSSDNYPSSKIKWKIKNLVDEIEIKDITSSYAIHRGLKRESVSHSIIYEAIKPGKFILKIGQLQQELIIYPKESNLTKVVTQVVGKEWEENVSSHSLPINYNKSHYTNTTKLRVGDTMILSFDAYVQLVDSPKKVDSKITIEKLPINN